ncbi:hypothetical protein TWF730_003288 [Orbilia blumenaviensis]|uniref:F-box domain-containing protein n=1 Tax=Orbilia blumenaviensis TaxID=1796055 RepID=A0AAV9U4T6_9PEZI
MKKQSKVPSRKASNNSKCHVFSLPNELQAKILSSLSIHDQINVCKAFRRWQSLLLDTKQFSKSRYPVRLDSYPQYIGLHTLLNCGEYTIKILVKDGAILRIYHSPIEMSFPLLRPMDFIWLFTEDCESTGREGYFDVTDSPFMDEACAKPFPYSSYNLKPTSLLEENLLAGMYNLDDQEAYFQVGFIVFVPDDIEAGTVQAPCIDERVDIGTGEMSVREVVDEIMERAKQAVEDEEIDLEACRGMYLIQIHQPQLVKMY